MVAKIKLRSTFDFALVEFAQSKQAANCHLEIDSIQLISLPL